MSPERDPLRSGIHCVIDRCDHADPSAAARDLVQRALASAGLDPGQRHQLVHDAHGRPLFESPTGSRVGVSISHAGPWVAMAICAHDVGIDIEPLDRRVRDPARMAARFFCASEADWVRTQIDPTLAFLELWTIKESIGKAMGVGLHGGSTAALETGPGDRLTGAGSVLGASRLPGIFQATLLSHRWVVSLAARRPEPVFVTEPGR